MNPKLVFLAVAVMRILSANDHDVREFGAVGDGVSYDTGAVQSAVDACSAGGGGTVTVPPGKFLCGPLFLKSGVRLRLQRGAIILAGTNAGEYAPRNFPSIGEVKTVRLIQAIGISNVAIDGGGMIDGRGYAFWNTRTEGPLSKLSWSSLAQHKNKETQYRPSPIIFEKSSTITVSNITITNSARWTIHILESTNVVVSHVRIRNDIAGIHTDGIDVNSSMNVTVRDCDIHTGDDGLCVKTRSKTPCGNVTFERCTVTTAANAFRIGTETFGDIFNISVSNCIFVCTSPDAWERSISGIGIACQNGGNISDVAVRNIVVSNVRSPISLRLTSIRERNQTEVPHTGSVSNIVLANISAYHSMLPAVITGMPDNPLTDIMLTNIHLEYEGGVSLSDIAPAMPDEKMTGMNAGAMTMGVLPAYGLYARHVRGLHIFDARIRYVKEDSRSAIIADRVQGMTLCRLAVERVSGENPVIALIGSKNVIIDAQRSTAGSRVQIDVSGMSKSDANITLSANDMSKAEHYIQYR